MKVGDLAQLTRFDEVPFIGIYLGPSIKLDSERKRYEGRFLLHTGIVRDIDLGNHLVWNIKVIS